MNKLSSIFSDEQLDAIAVETGFIKRRRKFTAARFLRALLFDHLDYDTPSLEQHALIAYQDGQTIISKQAIDKKFNDKSLLFIKKIFEILLAKQHLTTDISSHLLAHFNTVKVMDSTEFKLPNSFVKDFPGYGESNALACAAIQLEYDALSGKIEHFELNSARQSDKTVADLRMDRICPGDLILRDLGYYSIDSYLKIEQQKAFYVSRLKSQIAIYEKQGDEYRRISWKQILQRISKSKNGVFDQWVYIGKNQKHPVRMGAWVIEEEASQNRLKQKQAKRGKLKKEDEIWSKLNVFITNIQSDILEIEQLYNLYKIRWQIELIFKIWKSILNIDKIRQMKTCRLKCYLYSKFIWILICGDIIEIAEGAYGYGKHAVLSRFKCTAILKTLSNSFKMIIFRDVKRLKEWLMKTTEVLINYGLKEERKGRKKLSELLQLTTELNTKNTIFATVPITNHSHLKTSVVFKKNTYEE